jgi:hypothetical protein
LAVGRVYRFGVPTLIGSAIPGNEKELDCDINADNTQMILVTSTNHYVPRTFNAATTSPITSAFVYKPMITSIYAFPQIASQ